MGQKITIKIADRKYGLNASSPENEELIRSAAEAVNSRLNALTTALPGKNPLDLITMVALNMSIGVLSSQREVDAVKHEVQSAEQDLTKYLKSIE